MLKQFFLRGRKNLVVTGTRGKTTTTALLTWILKSAGLEPSYMIGGIPTNLGQGACFNDSKYFVIEGDDYDTAFFDKRSKFIHYLPKLLIVNNIEFDHADIFPNLDAIKLSFRQLINIVPQNGMLLLNGDDPNCVECRRDLAPAGASAAKKRYRGSFQQWGFDWDSREAARTARSIGGSIMKIALCCLVLATISVSGLQAGTAPGLDAVQVASGLTQPLFVTAPPGDFRRLFIVQQDGNIRILNLLTSTLNPAPFLTLTGLTDTVGEQGLLGMAFDPNYATNGKFYLNFTVPGGAFGNGVTHVSQFSVSGNPDIADPNSERILITFDRQTGRMFIGDVGQDTREEIDVQQATNAGGGENYGWRVREGSIQNPAFPGSPIPPGAIDPIFDYSHSVGQTVIGGYVYRGNRIPDLRGVYVFGDYSEGQIFSFDYDGSTVSNFQTITSQLFPTSVGGFALSHPSSLGEDANGELYITDIGNGSVFKTVSSAGWSVVGVADFNPDGHPDYRLYNGRTRQTAIWYLNNNVLSSGLYGPTLTDGWSVAGVADFNGDGHPDYLLFSSSTRQTAIWYLNNNVLSSGLFGPSLPASWSVAAVGHFIWNGYPGYLVF